MSSVLHLNRLILLGVKGWRQGRGTGLLEGCRPRDQGGGGHVSEKGPTSQCALKGGQLGGAA